MSALVASYDGTSWHRGVAQLCTPGTEVRLVMTSSSVVGTVEKIGHDYLMLVDDNDQILVKVAAIEAIIRV